MFTTSVQNDRLVPGYRIWPVLARLQKWAAAPSFWQHIWRESGQFIFQNVSANVISLPLYAPAMQPDRIHRQAQISKSHNFVTVANRTDVDMQFLTRCEVRNLSVDYGIMSPEIYIYIYEVAITDKKQTIGLKLISRYLKYMWYKLLFLRKY